jgi:hypothetical protein
VVTGPGDRGAPATRSCNSGCSEEDRVRLGPTLTPAVLLNLTSFGLVTVGLIVLLVIVSLLHRGPTRPCHRCGRKVPLDKRVCGHCGYEFEPIRFTS